MNLPVPWRSVIPLLIGAFWKTDVLWNWKELNRQIFSKVFVNFLPSWVTFTNQSHPTSLPSLNLMTKSYRSKTKPHRSVVGVNTRACSLHSLGIFSLSLSLIDCMNLSGLDLICCASVPGLVANVAITCLLTLIWTPGVNRTHCYPGKISISPMGT